MKTEISGIYVLVANIIITEQILLTISMQKKIYFAQHYVQENKIPNDLFQPVTRDRLIKLITKHWKSSKYILIMVGKTSTLPKHFEVVCSILICSFPQVVKPNYFSNRSCPYLQMHSRTSNEYMYSVHSITKYNTRAHTNACVHIHARTHARTDARTHTQPFYGSLDFVRDNPGEPIPEETFTHSHPSWSSIIPYLFPPSITIHGILPVQFTCLLDFIHNKCKKL